MKLFLLANILNSFFSITEPETLASLAKTLRKGESVWVTGKLSNSYDNEILASMGLALCGKSIEEYQTSFWDLGLEIEHLEIKREMMVFNSLDELKNWILQQVKNPVLAEEFISAMQKKGWIPIGENKIGFPTQELIACVRTK